MACFWKCFARQQNQSIELPSDFPFDLFHQLMLGRLAMGNDAYQQVFDELMTLDLFSDDPSAFHKFIESVDQESKAGKTF